MTEPDELPPAIPAATVVLLRDGASGVEALLVQRNSKLAFAGGHWVFPGGRVDAADEPVTSDDRTVRPPPADVDEARARAAAVRETAEEAGLVIDAAELVWFAHWTPPPVQIKRFATWFFVARAPAGEVTIDGGEIHDHAWFTPAEALAARDAGTIELSPPTWITLHTLCRFDDVAAALDALMIEPTEYFTTHICMVDGGILAIWDGDAAYGHDDPDLPGGRHRLAMMDTGWTYEREVT